MQNVPEQEGMKVLLPKIRELTPANIAKQLLSVQPVDPEPFLKMVKHAQSKEQLEAAGFRPVSHLDLMWVKP